MPELPSTPADPPEWASNNNYSEGPDEGTPTKLSPSNENIDTTTADGYINGPDHPPDARLWNWWKNLVGYQWIVWLRDAVQSVNNRFTLSANSVFANATASESEGDSLGVGENSLAMRSGNSALGSHSIGQNSLLGRGTGDAGNLDASANASYFRAGSGALQSHAAGNDTLAGRPDGGDLGYHSRSDLDVADRDHAGRHLPEGDDPITTGTPAALTVGGSNVEGSANYLANGLHRHAVASGTPVALTPGGSNSAGDSGNFVHSNHQHQLPPFGTASGEFAEGNHSHDLESLGAAPALDLIYRSLQNRKPYAWGNLPQWKSDGDGNSVAVGTSGVWYLAPGSSWPVEIDDAAGVSNISDFVPGSLGYALRFTGGKFVIVAGDSMTIQVFVSTTGAPGTWSGSSQMSAPIVTDCIVVGDDLICTFDEGSIRMIEDYDTSPSITVLDDGTEREAIAAIAAGQLEISGTLEDVLMVCCSDSGSDGGWHYAEDPYTSWTQVPFSAPFYENDQSYGCLAYVPESRLWCFGRSDSANSALRRMFVDGSIDFLPNSTPADILNQWADLHVVDGANVVIGVGFGGRVLVGRADTTDPEVDWRHVYPDYGDGSADLTSIAFDGRRYLMGQDGYGVYVAHSHDHGSNPTLQRVERIDTSFVLNTGDDDDPVLWKIHEKQVGPNASIRVIVSGQWRIDGHSSPDFLASFGSFDLYINARTNDGGVLVGSSLFQTNRDYSSGSTGTFFTDPDPVVAEISSDEIIVRGDDTVSADVDNAHWEVFVVGSILRVEVLPGILT